MSLPRFSLRHPQIVLAFTVVGVVGGIIAFMNAPRRSDPEFTIRMARISTVWPGVETERVERLVTAPIERAIAELDDVEDVESITTPGLSVITVSAFNAPPAREIPQLWDRVRGQVRNMQESLPDGVRTPMIDSEFGETAVLQVAVFSTEGLDGRPTYSPRELKDFAELIRDRFELQAGVASAQVYGVREEQVFIEASPDLWAANELSIEELQSALSARNIRVAGGSVDVDAARVSVQPTGELEEIGEISRLVVGRSENGAPILLGDTGLTVRRGYADPPLVVVRYGSAAGSTDAIIVSVIMLGTAQATTLAPQLLETVETMRSVERLLPPDLGVEAVFDEARFVDGKIRSFLVSLVQAVALVVVVALLLAGVRSAMVMAAAIPIVMCISFGLATRLGVALEQMSIASLIISLGLMVDNAVVVSDNSRRFMSMGLPRREATGTGVEEVLVPTLMGTLTTVFVFLPMTFALEGPKVEFIFSIPAVVGITLLTSWLAGMTFTTLMASAVIRPVPEGRSASPLAWVAHLGGNAMRRLGVPTRGFAALYGDAIGLALRGRWVVILVFALLFVAAIRLPIGSQFFPDDRRDQYYVDVWLPQGTSLAATDGVTAEVEDLIREIGAEMASERRAAGREPAGLDGTASVVKSIYASIGGSGPRFALGIDPTAPTPNFAQLIVTTDDPMISAPFVERLRVAAEKRIAGARVIPTKFGLGPPVATPIGVRLSSIGLDDPGFADIPELRDQADRILQVAADTPGVWDPHLSWGEVASEVEVDIDPERAVVAGVTNEAVAATLRAYLSGQTLTYFRDGALEIPVVFRLPEDERTLDLSPRRLFVEGADGKVPLDAVADVRVRPATTRIERRNNQRMIEIRARNHEGFLANECLAAMKPRVEEIRRTLPPGMSIEYGGEIEEASSAQTEFAVAFGIGFLLLLLVLVVQYSSFVKPVLVLATVPMGVIGAMLGLYVTNEALGFMQMLGLVALSGMVVNSAILYLEFADSRIAEALTSHAAGDADDASPVTACGLPRSVLRGCLAEAGRIRLLPILLTALTTIGGFIPLLFGGPLWRGLAAVMIGGLSVATVLTLLVLPVLYATLIEVFRFRPINHPDLVAGESPTPTDAASPHAGPESPTP